MSEDLFTGAFENSSAWLSDCRTFRYDLWRRWNPNEPTVAFVGLNPSTADETKDDATIRKCVGYAKRWGFGSLCMLNLFAFRATQPKDMMRAIDPVGPGNNTHLVKMTRKATIVIAAWGKDGSFMGRDKAAIQIISPLLCLHLNKDGSPGHPLYLPGDAKPFPFLP